MNNIVNFIFVVLLGGLSFAGEGMREISLSDESHAFKLNMNQKDGAISVKKIRGLGVVPDSPALIIKLSNGEEKKVQLRLVSLYEKKNPTFEGLIDPLYLNQGSRLPIVAIELSFESGGKPHSLRWKFKQSHFKE